MRNLTTPVAKIRELFILRRNESHDTSTEGPACSSHKEEEEALTTTSVKMVLCARLNKHKSKVKQNAIVSH